ncbi:serine-threonine kinase receptor-associated protein-like [Mya arenaria]|uniref:serine-threonine kinase receptor-associated protein-like n=1 Tax=Mya arenaria TaxID=6604 RepID=UPI0022E422FC|nr:serine-threonine kinase receptor-associated protein-like [Mya arenaria]
MSSLKQTPLTCSGHTRPVVFLNYSDITPFGYFLISASKDGKPMLRQGDTGDWIGTFEGHKGAVWGAALTRDATKAATGAADFTAKVWDAESGEELKTFQHKHIVKCVDFSNDGNYLLTGSQEKILRIFDLEKPDEDPQAFSGHTAFIKNALFKKNGKQIISAADDKTVRVWDVSSGKEVQKLDFPAIPTSLDLTQDGSILIVTHGSTTSFWNADTLDKIKDFESPTQITTASLHPDKTIFISGGENFIMYKSDFNTGEELEAFKGHFGSVHCVRFSPDGEVYASGSEDGTLRLWQTTVGKTYGLWKCVTPDEIVNNTDSTPTKPEA